MCYLICKKAALLFIALLVALNVTAITSDYSVTHYTNENGLPQNSIKGIELDKNGFLWLATESGLLRFDGRQFKLFDKNHFPLITSNRISFIGLTKDSIVYFFDEYRNYYSFNNQQELTRLDAKAVPVPLKELSGYDRRELDLDKIKGKDEGFIGTSDSLFYISSEKKLWARRLPDPNFDIFKSSGHLNEKFYYLNKQLKIKSVDRKGNIKDVLLKGVHPDLKATGPYNYCFFQQAQILYLLIGKGIYQLHESGEQELTADLVLQTDVPGIFSYRSYPALNLQVVGSITHGLYLYRKNQFKALRHTNGYGIFYPQAVYQDSGVLTSRGLVYPSFSKFNYPFGISERWRGLLRDSRGHYWVNIEDTCKKATCFNIAELDEHLKIVKKYRGWTANCFQETPDGNIWLSSGEKRIGKIKEDSMEWLPKTWPERSILTFLPETNEEFWIGGFRTFAKLNVRTGKEQHYKRLEQFTIETLYLDADKVLWIGTTGNGFFALKQNKVYQLPLDIKNNLSNVHAFIEDKSGFMWMSTNNGLVRCKKEELNHFIDHKIATVYYQYFSKESGFNTNEFNGSCTPSAVVLGNGKFSFPSLDGLVQFYPDSIKEALPASKIFIDKLLIDGKQQLLTGNRIDIDPSFKYLEVQVASPYFGHPANQMLEYRLNGLDSTWQPLKEDNTVVFNNLAYGKYNLQFRKRAGFGSNNFITTSVLLSVDPFFYQTLYFKAALLIAMCLLVFLIVKLRYAYLVKRNKALEQEVEQRTIHLRSANHLKEKILMMVGHDLQSPLHFLGYLSESNYDALMSEEHEKAGLISREMKNTTKKIYAFVDEFNLWARVQDERFHLKKTTFPLGTLLSELQLFFKEILELRGNRFTFTMSREYELYTNRDLLKAVLRNLVDNANKHTRDGVISIDCTEDKNETCLIRVSDTGTGMSPEVLNRLRELISNRDKAVIIEPGSKLGYQFIIDFVVRIGASVTIDSEKNKGTNVSIHGITAGVSASGTLHHH